MATAQTWITITSYTSPMQDLPRLITRLASLCCNAEPTLGAVPKHPTTNKPTGEASPPAVASRTHGQFLQAGIPAIIALDEAYHWLYYNSTTSPRRPRPRAPIPDPPTYFAILACNNPTISASAASTTTGRNLPSTPTPPNDTCVSTAAAPATPNPLLILLEARTRETTAYFGSRRAVPLAALVATGMGTHTPGGAPTLKRMEPVCDALLATWRSSVRTFTCRLFSFAVPSDAALTALAEHAPLVEVGAGTGYWAALLQQRLVDVVALDSHPTAHVHNEYHGRSASWCAVQRGTLEAHMRGRALLLCYPPPDSDMAEATLQRFVGDTVCYCGEWEGDTATAAFQSALLRDWRLTRRVPLPNWGDTCYELMIWRRARMHCHGTHCDERQPGKGDLREAGGSQTGCVTVGKRLKGQKRKKLLSAAADTAAVTGEHTSGGCGGTKVALHPVATTCDVCGTMASQRPLRRCRMTCCFSFCSEACLRVALADFRTPEVNRDVDTCRHIASAVASPRGLGAPHWGGDGAGKVATWRSRCALCKPVSYRHELTRRHCSVDPATLTLSDERVFRDLPFRSCRAFHHPTEFRLDLQADMAVLPLARHPSRDEAGHAGKKVSHCCRAAKQRSRKRMKRC